MNRHEAPVWQVAWAHPKFGSILASCSYDGRVFIWKEQNNVWTRIKEHNVHTASGNKEHGGWTTIERLSFLFD